MAVLVTGGAGYIGSHMVWELLDAADDVVVLDRLSTGFEWAVAPEAKLVVGDIGDIDLVKSIVAEHKIDAIIHFAGSIVVPACGGAAAAPRVVASRSGARPASSTVVTDTMSPAAESTSNGSAPARLTAAPSTNWST